MMFTCRSYSGRQAEAMHLANFCFPDDRFDAELAALSADILANSWYANQVNKRALMEIDGLSLTMRTRSSCLRTRGWRRMRRSEWLSSLRNEPLTFNYCESFAPRGSGQACIETHNLESGWIMVSRDERGRKLQAIRGAQRVGA